jgi:hypothetical protein
MNIFIPTPPQAYNPSAIAQAFNVIKRSLSFAVSTEEAVESVLLQASDGSVWRVTVDTAGNLTTTAVPIGTR